MSADGNWKLTLATPMGPHEMQMSVATAGDAFTGRIDSPMGSEDVNGTVADDRLTWTMDVTKPMKIKLSFDVTVSGDTMDGSAKLGMFGKSALTGERL